VNLEVRPHLASSDEDGKAADADRPQRSSCDGVNTMITDARGSLWLYTQCGLIEIEGAELQRWWADSAVVVQRRVLDVFEGVRPGRAPFAAAARSANGRLWFANGIVLQMLEPTRLTGNTVAPPVSARFSAPPRPRACSGQR